MVGLTCILVITLVLADTEFVRRYYSLIVKGISGQILEQLTIPNSKLSAYRAYRL